MTNYVTCIIVTDIYAACATPIGVRSPPGVSCRSCELPNKSIVLLVSRFVVSLGYYGVTFNSPNLGGSDHLNFFLSGLVEIPAYIVCPIVLDRLGRRWPLCGSLVLCGLTLLCTVPVPPGTHYVAFSYTIHLYFYYSQL